MDAYSSDLSLRLKLAKLSAERVFTESGFHTVDEGTKKAREAAEMTILAIVVERWCAVEDRSSLGN